MRISLVVFCLMCLTFWRGSGTTYSIDRKTLADNCLPVSCWDSVQRDWQKSSWVLKHFPFQLSYFSAMTHCFLSGFMPRQGCCWILNTCCSGKMMVFFYRQFFQVYMYENRQPLYRLWSQSVYSLMYRSVQQKLLCWFKILAKAAA